MKLTAEKTEIPSQKSSLWRHADFLRLWSGQTVSEFGTQITTLAMPFLAALTLHANTEQMGFLTAAATAPYLVIPLFAGIWVDRYRRRPIMLIANLGQGLLLLAVPFAALFGWLRLEFLYAITFLTGLLQVFFEMAYQTYVPSLVGNDLLVDGNSKLQMSKSMAQTGGPGLAGLLVESITAPFAILFDGLSYLFSALSLATIRHPEPPPSSPGSRQSLKQALASGFHIIFTNSYLRALMTEAAIFNFFSTMSEALIVLYATRELALRPALFGLLVTTGSIGSIIGSLFAHASGRRWGVGRTLFISYALACIPGLCIPLSGLSGPGIFSIVLLATGYFLSGIGGASTQIFVWSIRQATTPPHLLGRMNGTYRFFVSGVVPLGALAGGFLGSFVGILPTLFIAAIGMVLAPIVISLSPLFKLHSLPVYREDTSSQQKETEEQI